MARLTTTALTDWLKPQLQTITGINNLSISPGRPTDKPDRQIGVQRVGASRIVMEGGFEEITFRIEYRGRRNDLEDAENIAVAMDSFLWGRNNFDIGNVTITSVSYGASLRQLPASDNASRFSFTADYKFTSSREG